MTNRSIEGTRRVEGARPAAPDEAAKPPEVNKKTNKAITKRTGKTPELQLIRSILRKYSRLTSKASARPGRFRCIPA